MPQNSEVDELRALVRKHAHVAAGGWTFEDWSFSNLKYVVHVSSLSRYPFPSPHTP